jgi:hypothetical protein
MTPRWRTFRDRARWLALLVFVPVLVAILLAVLVPALLR